MNPSVVAVLLFVSTVNGTQTPGETAQISGTVPNAAKPVTLAIDQKPLHEAIKSLATQAGWGLALSLPEEVADRAITVHVSDQPAVEALRVLLELGDASADFSTGVLVVRVAETGRLHYWHAGRHDRHGHVDQAKNERVGMGHDVVVGKDDVVDEAVALGGSVTVFGTVRNAAVAVGGSVRVESGAKIEGDAIAIGGEVVIAEGGTVTGDQVSLGSSLGGVVRPMLALAGGVVPLVFLGFMATLLRVIVILILGALLISFAPERVHNVAARLAAQPGLSFVTGLAVLVSIVPLCVLLAITLVGIPMIPLLMMCLVGAMLLGMTAFCTFLGQRLPIFQEHKSPLAALLLGLVLVGLVDLIPVFGTIALILASFVAGGAAILSRFGGRAIPAAITPAP